MKALALIFLTLAGAVLGTHLAKIDPGYVLLTRGDWSVELSLTVFLFLLFAVVLLLYWLSRIFGGAVRSPKRLGLWRQRRSSNRHLQKSALGLIELVEGNWARAEQILKNTTADGPIPVLGHLAAAYAAQQQDLLDHRDQYLDKAAEAALSNSLVVGLTRARLQMNAGQWPDAQHTLQDLQRQQPRHQRVVQYLLELYRAQGDWRALLDQLATAKKLKVLPQPDLEALQTEACEALLSTAAADRESLMALWNTFEKSSQQQPGLLAVYADRLLQVGAGDVVSPLLTKLLKRQLDDRLLEAYTRIEGDTVQQLGFLEGLLNKYPRNPVLLQNTARLCQRDKLWGKARGYLEAAVAEGAEHTAYLELGDLYKQLGESTKASECFRKGLAQSQHIAVQLLTESSGAEDSVTADGVVLNSKES